MFSHSLGIAGLIIFAVIALKTIEGGGDWFDILQNNAKYEAGRADFDFKVAFFMIGVFVVGIIGFAVYKGRVEESTPIYRSAAQPAPVEQKTATHITHKSHMHHVVATKK
jgi:hypothetical protein